MAPLTKAQITKFLQDCTPKKAQTGTYTALLGFRKLSRSRSRQGPQVYTGVVDLFYEDTADIVNDLSNKYKSRKEVQEAIIAQETFTHQSVEDSLYEYAPDIWTDGVSEPFVTVIDGDSYPRHLIWNNEEDQTRIRTYVYGLILQRTCRNLGKKPHRQDEDESITMDMPNAPLRRTTYEQITVLPPDPDVANSGLLNSGLGLDRAPNLDEQAGSHPMSYEVPVAQMIPTGSHPRNSLRKRRRSTLGEEPGTNFEYLEVNGRANRAARLRRIGSSRGFSYPSPPDPLSDDEEPRTEQTSEDNIAVLIVRNYEDNGRDGTKTVRHGLLPLSPLDYTDDNFTITHNAHADNSMASEASHNANDDEDDIDSVQGSPSESVAIEEPSTPTAEEDDKPTMVVKLRLSRAAAQLRLDRKYLALKLPKALDLTHQQPGLLEETLELIERLRRADTRFEETFGDAQSTFQQILDQWLEFVRISIQFRKTVQFPGDQTWEAHLNTLDLTSRFAAGQSRIEASIHIEEWRLKHPDFSVLVFSRDVTHVLVGMADWMRVLSTGDTEELKRRMTEFNQDLLASFK